MKPFFFLLSLILVVAALALATLFNQIKLVKKLASLTRFGVSQ